MGRKGIEVFGRVEFEAALPKSKADGSPCWTYAGFLQGEHCYIIRPFPALPYGVLVRSSVKGDGVAAECGEDSIRGRIVKLDGDRFQFHGGKSQRWVTRQAGWQDRLTAMLRKLANQVNYCRPCPKCGTDLVPFTTKSAENGNKGKGFVKCCSVQCQPDAESGRSATFYWTDDEDKDPTPPPAELLNNKGCMVTQSPACPKCRASMVRMGRGAGFRCATPGNRWEGGKWSKCDGVVWDNAPQNAQNAASAPISAQGDSHPDGTLPPVRSEAKRQEVKPIPPTFAELLAHVKAALGELDDAGPDNWQETYASGSGAVAKLKQYVRFRCG